jgi:hypothetical protein
MEIKPSVLRYCLQLQKGYDVKLQKKETEVALLMCQRCGVMIVKRL